MQKALVAAVLAVVLLGAGMWYYLRAPNAAPPSTTLSEAITTYPIEGIIGRSVEGRSLEAYTYGNGAVHLVFVGGMHGGYEWNSILLAQKIQQYLTDNPSVIPTELRVTVIPNLNPDGLFTVTKKEGPFTQGDIPQSRVAVESGRFNANAVDLNRNFDCKWEPVGSWRSKEVSAGTAPFSEPESKALRDFILKEKPAAVVFFHSQANAVYASECNEGVLPETKKVMQVYADAAGYPAIESFDAYPVHGDAEGWLATIGVAAITVELKTHETIEWEKNKKGVEAILRYYHEKQ